MSSWFTKIILCGWFSTFFDYNVGFKHKLCSSTESKCRELAPKKLYVNYMMKYISHLKANAGKHCLSLMKKVIVQVSCNINKQ